MSAALPTLSRAAVAAALLLAVTACTQGSSPSPTTPERTTASPAPTTTLIAALTLLPLIALAVHVTPRASHVVAQRTASPTQHEDRAPSAALR